jgi:hypothetical protein
MASNDPLHVLIAENNDRLVNLGISGYGVISTIHDATWAQDRHLRAVAKSSVR